MESSEYKTQLDSEMFGRVSGHESSINNTQRDGKKSKKFGQFGHRNLRLSLPELSTNWDQSHNKSTGKGKVESYDFGSDYLDNPKRSIGSNLRIETGGRNLDSSFKAHIYNSQSNINSTN